MQYVKRSPDGIWRPVETSPFDDSGVLHPPSLEELALMNTSKQKVEAPVRGRPVVERVVALVTEGEGWADV